MRLYVQHFTNTSRRQRFRFFPFKEGWLAEDYTASPSLISPRRYSTARVQQAGRPGRWEDDNIQKQYSCLRFPNGSLQILTDQFCHLLLSHIRNRKPPV